MVAFLQQVMRVVLGKQLCIDGGLVDAMFLLFMHSWMIVGLSLVP